MSAPGFAHPKYAMNIYNIALHANLKESMEKHINVKLVKLHILEKLTMVVVFRPVHLVTKI